MGLILAHGVRSQSIVVGMSHGDLETHGRTTSTVEKRREKSGCSSYFFHFTVQEMVSPTIKMGLSTAINVIKTIPHRHSQP